MKLYYSRGACSLTPHILLREAGLPFTLERMDSATHRTEHDVDYYTINPKGYVAVARARQRRTAIRRAGDLSVHLRLRP